MRDQPDGLALLETAQRLLEGDLLPLLPEEKQPEAQRIARAMAVAARQGEAGDAALRDELRDLVAVLKAPPPPEGLAGPALERALHDLSWRLSMRIRAGSCDPGRSSHAATHAYLLATTRRKQRASADRVDDATAGP